MSDFFSFKLPEDFIAKYTVIDSPFGFSDAGNNSLGEITFIRTYSVRVIWTDYKSELQTNQYYYH